MSGRISDRRGVQKSFRAFIGQMLCCLSSASARRMPLVWKNFRPQERSKILPGIHRADAVLFEFRICPENAKSFRADAVLYVGVI